jgi:hypothetical protein
MRSSLPFQRFAANLSIRNIMIESHFNLAMGNIVLEQCSPSPQGNRVFSSSFLFDLSGTVYGALRPSRAAATLLIFASRSYYYLLLALGELTKHPRFRTRTRL